jgi:hypothetical protein
MIFVTAAQIFKFKSSVISEADLKLDDNVWNDRESDDFLRYIKHDFFIVVYILTQFFMNIVLGFSDVKMIKHMGQRDFQLKLCMVVFIVMRGNQLLIYGYTLINGKNFT